MRGNRDDFSSNQFHQNYLPAVRFLWIWLKVVSDLTVVAGKMTVWQFWRPDRWKGCRLFYLKALSISTKACLSMCEQQTWQRSSHARMYKLKWNWNLKHGCKCKLSIILGRFTWPEQKCVICFLARKLERLWKKSKMWNEFHSWNQKDYKCFERSLNMWNEFDFGLLHLFRAAAGKALSLGSNW